MLLQLSQFSPFAPSYPASPGPSGNPHTTVHAHGFCIYVLWLLFSLLYIPWLFCDYQLVLLSPFIFFSHTPNAPPIWQPSKHSLYLQFCFCSACLFIPFFRLNYWQICIYCHFIVNIFDLLLKEDPRILRIILVWWWWTPLAFSCLGNTLSVLWF